MKRVQDMNSTELKNLIEQLRKKIAGLKPSSGEYRMASQELQAAEQHLDEKELCTCGHRKSEHRGTLCTGSPIGDRADPKHTRNIDNSTKQCDCTHFHGTGKHY